MMANNRPAPVLLIGNGPNRLGEGYSWSDLILDLRGFVGAQQPKPYDERKPFPLMYEELVVQGYRQSRSTEERIKDFICEQTEKLKSNEIHKRIVEMKFEHILTTNYDDTLEKAAQSSFRDPPTAGPIRETRYSLFRNHQFDAKEPMTIWHIHGYQQTPGSVLLGYDHYSGYLQAMYSYVRKGYRRGGESFPPLVKRLQGYQLEPHGTFDRTWVDFFFTRDIYILGLSLDFVEFHLWWLLTFRPRAEIGSGVEIMNTVYYLYRDDDSASSADFQAKRSLLNVAQVNTVPLSGNRDWYDFYNEALDWIINNFQ